MGIGTLINAVGVLLGGALGILVGHRISNNIQQAIMKVAGVSFKNKTSIDINSILAFLFYSPCSSLLFLCLVCLNISS